MRDKCMSCVLARQRVIRFSSGSKLRRPQVIRTLPTLSRLLAQWRARRNRIALVPTMGALHAGHLALVRRAQRRADRVVVSIFVNPAQFAPHEDLNTYPRTFAADVAALAELRADLVWAPAGDTMYPPGYATRIVPAGPAAAGLEDAFRPHFFAGVATVVAKLLIQCGPDIAVFGEKDYQQLKVVTRMVLDLDLGVEIVAVSTIRAKDGLALSSRNQYLSRGERANAPLLYAALMRCRDALQSGVAIEAALANAYDTLAVAGFDVDYVEARHAESLAPVATLSEGPVRLLAAAKLGTTRLIDNIAV